MAILAAIFTTALGVPKKAVAQPEGTVCAASTDPSDAEFGIFFTANVQSIPDLDNALCNSGVALPQGYSAPGFAGSDALAVFNNVFHSGVGFTAGFSVVTGTNVTNLLLNGAPYTQGTQVPLATADAFNGTLQFDFNGGSFQFTIVKTAGSNTIQGFTIEVATTPAASSPSPTQRVINNFMVHRADQIIANEPDIAARLVGRYGAANGSAPDVSASGEDGSFDVAFATSLSQIASANPSTRNVDFATATALADTSALADPLSAATPAYGADLWIRGAWSRLDSGDTTSDLALIHVGADYRVSDDLLIGVLGQVDWSDEENGAVNAQVDGFGWMAGPYVAARVHDQLILDARAAWGRSYNDVSPTGTHTDSFDTQRWLTSGGLTGDIRLHHWHLTPRVGILYFRERQKGYTDGLGVVIPDQTVSLGQLTFGPEAAYLYRPTEDWLIGPKVGAKGIWSFNDAEVLDAATGATDGTDDLRVRAEGGVSITYDDRYTLTADGFYDGIAASDYHAFGGSLTINVLIADGFLLTGESFVSTGAASNGISIGGFDPVADYRANLRLRYELF